MKPTYAIAAIAIAGITAAGGTAAFAATAGHGRPAGAGITVTPVTGGRPGTVLPGHARPVSARPVATDRCPVLVPVSGKPVTVVPGHARPAHARLRVERCVTIPAITTSPAGGALVVR